MQSSSMSLVEELNLKPKPCLVNMTSILVVVLEALIFLYAMHGIFMLLVEPFKHSTSQN